MSVNAHISTEGEWMTLAEISRRLGISLTVAYELARKDALPVPTIRVGRQFRFSRKAYADLTAAQHTPEPTAA